MSDVLARYLREIGCRELPPRLVPFDPGYDPVTLESHLAQSSHLMMGLKLSMACWIIAAEPATRAKIAAAKRHGVSTTTGGGPFEVAVQLGKLDAYLEMCAALGFDGIECGEGFTDLTIPADEVVRRVHAHGLTAQFEVGKKHLGKFDTETVSALCDQGKRWLDAGARKIVVEARESGADVGMFDSAGALDSGMADHFVQSLGMENLIFEAPNKKSQFALLSHFGETVQLTNVRIEEVLRVEIYRRRMHSDAFDPSWFAPA